jgi:hypothetical protein
VTPAEPVSPVESIDTIHDVVSIATNQTEIFVAACPTGFSQLGSAYIFALDATNGGAATVLNTTPLWGSPAGLEVMGNNLIVAVHPEPEGRLPEGSTPMTGIYRLPIAGGPVVPLWQGLPLVKPNRLAIVGSTIYVADMDAGPGGSGAILSLPASGGQPTVVAQGGLLDDPVALAATSSGLYIADRGHSSSGAAHKDPGMPGKILFLPFDSNQPTLVAQGGLLKNPLDLELIGDTLYIADEGQDERAQQGVYSLSVAGWRSGVDLSSSLAVVHQGEPFVEPIALAAVQGKLYVADDTGTKTFKVRITASSNPVAVSGPSSH